MTGGENDIDLRRFDRDEAGADADRDASSGGAESDAVAARTRTVGTYPTASNRYYAMETLIITGAQVENGAGVETGAGDTWYAYNLGSAIPPSGTKVLCRSVPYRWVFRYDG